MGDVGFLLPIAAGVALASFPVGYAGQSQVRLVLDGLIVEGSLFLVAWAVVLGSVYADAGASHVALILALAYAVADTMTFTVGVLVLARARTRQRLTLTLLTAGLAVMAVSDTTFVGLIAHHTPHREELVAVGWGRACCCWAWRRCLACGRSPPIPARPRACGAAARDGADVVALCAAYRGRRDHPPWATGTACKRVRCWAPEY